ncbi:unnamed protein product [Diabrotica balteata]|uniref:Uncharacterized protein n=1 Tax=Diabrotica balteata TaxID=107213 RepID=A0A9N9XDY0_DIABA|nr:unnamed protein product [Diabrotica balteata]
MSRNRRILELALKIVKYTLNLVNMEQNLFSGEMENLDIVKKDFDVTENPLYANTSYVSSDEILIQHGNDLFELKKKLRPGCSKFLDPNGSDVESSGHREPFSADVSEYVPSGSEGSSYSDGPKEKNLQEIDEAEPKTNLNIQTQYSASDIEHNSHKKKKRDMPEKCTSGRYWRLLESIESIRNPELI